MRLLTACTLATYLCSAVGAGWAQIQPPTKSAVAREVDVPPAPREPLPTPPAVVPERHREPTPTVQPQIILESRTSGCRVNAQDLPKVNGDLCGMSSPRPTVAAHRLSESEVRELVSKSSLPSNGDRQMLFPLTIPAIISSAFGYRIHPIDGVVQFHYGTDIAAPAGTPVVAVYSGRVAVAGWMGGLGWAVVLTHSDRLETRYAHLSQILVQQGEAVPQGRVIGLVGSSGKSTGPHLHFEMWHKGLDGLWQVIDSTPHVLLALENLPKQLARLDFRKPRIAVVE
jgi:murein DD-endopeptidase MepM/ murein hydrolase activator NlpD